MTQMVHSNMVIGHLVTINGMLKDTSINLCNITHDNQILDIFVVTNKALAGATMKFSIIDLNRPKLEGMNKDIDIYYTTLSIAAIPSKLTPVATDASIKSNENIKFYKFRDVLNNLNKRLHTTPYLAGGAFSLTATLQGVDATDTDITIYVRRVE